MAGESKQYTTWLRTQPCCAPECGTTRSIEVHHRTGAGMGLRAHDHKGMPLCNSCHVALHSAKRPFFGWDRARLRDWQDEQIAAHRARYLEEVGAAA